MDEGYGGRVPKRVNHEERRRQIADALLRTAATRGLHAAGMREVAAEAGVSLRLVQYYFGTKEELLLAAMQHLAARFGARAVARFREASGSGGPASPRDAIAAILAEALPADDDRRTFYVVYTAYLALSLTDPALAIAPLVKNSDTVIDVMAAQLRAAQAVGDTPAHLDPDLEAVSLMAMSAGLATSVLVGQSAIQQAQAVIDYHLYRLFPHPGQRYAERPMKGAEHCPAQDEGLAESCRTTARSAARSCRECAGPRPVPAPGEPAPTAALPRPGNAACPHRPGGERPPAAAG
jgi:AcrR family transcriptional regulator